MQVKTTDQLYAFMQSHPQIGASSPISPSSRYSTPSSVGSRDRADSYVKALGVQSNPFVLPARGSVVEGQRRRMTAMAMATTTGVNPVMAGLKRRYAAKPVGRLLEGATRKHEFQGYWMRRGTMRGLEVKHRKSWWKKKTELSVEESQDEPT